MGYQYVKGGQRPKKSLELVLYGQELGFDCESCRELNLCEGRGCIKGKRASAPYLYGRERIWECPLTFYNEEVGQAFALYGAYQKGFLPDKGSFLDQSSRFIEYMEFIGSVQRERENDKLEQMKRKKK